MNSMRDALHPTSPYFGTQNASKCPHVGSKRARWQEKRGFGYKVECLATGKRNGTLRSQTKNVQVSGDGATGCLAECPALRQC